MAETTADWHERQAARLAEQAQEIMALADWHTRQAEMLRECARMDAAMEPHEHHIEGTEPEEQ